jgi:SAM-dependent methyltransferase
MPETVAANLYDYPKYYDLIFGNDWKAEYDFLLAAIAKHGLRNTQRVFEPACGTGRLLIKLAQHGFEVAGNDLNPKAVKFCNDRLARYGFPRTAVVGDMSDFRVAKKFDAAFNMINSFRHLPTEAMARSHLQCVAAALKRGGIYLLGLHLTPTKGAAIEDEAWAARRGNLAVNSYMWTKKRDLKARNEELGMTFDVYTPRKQFRIEDEMHYRIYTARHMRRLLASVPELEVVETYDFTYDIEEPVEIEPDTEDVVFVLKKR